MFLFKRILYSLSFRVNITMFILFVILGWLFAHALLWTLSTVGSASQCYDISTAVTQSIDNNLQQVENGMKASALTSEAKRLTPQNSKTFCDSVCSIVDVDSVYVCNYRGDNPHITDSLRKMLIKGENTWTEPHKDKRGNVIITYLTPLQDKQDHTYAVLCADLSTKWIADLAKQENSTDNTTITVRSRKNLYIYNSDPQKILQVADSAEMSPENSKSHLLGGMQVANYNEKKNFACFDNHIDRTGWNVYCEQPSSDIGGVVAVTIALSLAFMFILFIVLAIVLMIVHRVYLHPLTKIAKATEEISHGNFDAEVPTLKMHTDIRQLRDNFVSMQQAIKQYIQDLRSTTEQKVSIERDITIAADIQQGMLPKSFDKRNDIDIYGMLHPAKVVGGDLYDYFVRRSYVDATSSQHGRSAGETHDYLFFILGDVSGKGVPAALIMSVVCHLFRNVSRRSTNAARIAGSINASLSERNDQNMFCTAFVGVLDLVTGHLEYCNAGHNAPIIIRGKESKKTEKQEVKKSGNQKSKETEFLETDRIQLPLGVDSHFLYTSESMQLNKNDMLFLYTDGVTEAENHDKQLFGDDATLKAVTLASHSVSMQTLVSNVLATVHAFTNGTEQSDDITMLALRRLVPDPEPLRTVTEELEREFENEKSKHSSPNH